MTSSSLRAFVPFLLLLVFFVMSARAERTISFDPYVVPSAGTIVIAVREGITGEGA